MSGNRKKQQNPLKRIFFQKDFVVSPVSRLLPYSKVSKNRRKQQNPLKNRYFQWIWSVLPILDTFRSRKSLETGEAEKSKTTKKSLETSSQNSVDALAIQKNGSKL